MQVLLILLSPPGLWGYHGTLLAVVHAPELVELSKVHIGLHAAILTWRE